MKWEYMYVFVEGKQRVADGLNPLGNDGWELVSARYILGAGGFDCILKRSLGKVSLAEELAADIRRELIEVGRRNNPIFQGQG